MDTKKALEQLLKIAAKQQKMIEKLAQTLPPPQQLEPIHPELRPQDVIMKNLSANLKRAIKGVNVLKDSEIYVYCTPGTLTDSVVSEFQTLVNSLLKANKLTGQSYKIFYTQ